MGNTKTLLGFLAGAAVGAIAGILLAPDKGSATRTVVPVEDPAAFETFPVDAARFQHR